MFGTTNPVNEVHQMTISIDVALLSGKQNKKLVSALLAQGFSLKVTR